MCWGEEVGKAGGKKVMTGQESGQDEEGGARMGRVALETEPAGWLGRLCVLQCEHCRNWRQVRQFGSGLTAMG